MDLFKEDTRLKMQAQFSTFSGERYTEGWSNLWVQGDCLPWDRKAPSPALAETLTTHAHLLGSPFVTTADGRRRRKRALVPGCGRGVDVLLLQSFGYDVVGLEVAPKAVEAAEQFAADAADAADQGDYAVKDREMGKGSRKFVLGDFFKDEWLVQVGLQNGDRFELIYDYTFFCAMQLEKRPAWAKRMSELLAPNQFSNLICLEFPSTKPSRLGGPPFSAPSKAYMEHLSHPGELVAYSGDDEVIVNPLVEVSPGGLERLTRFQ